MDAFQEQNGNIDASTSSRKSIELYLVRLFPPCRAVWLYMLQHDIPHTLIDVDFTSGDDSLPDLLKKQSHNEVPILVDGDVIVFESSAILRYLCQRYTDFSGFGPSLMSRALTDSIISWASCELHRAVGFCYVYPQYLDKYRLQNEEANESLVEYGLTRLTSHMESIEKRYLDKQKYLTGVKITIADSYVATILLQLEWTQFNFKMWPKVDAWLRRIKQQEYWQEVHATHLTFLGEIRNVNWSMD